MSRLGPSFAALVALILIACDASTPVATPSPIAGTPDAPREVNLVAKDYSFVPAALDLIPGETVLLHVINGGLEIHEAVIGDGPVQDAWEMAEAATVGAPPGPTPVVSVPPEVAGIRVVVASGERVDLRWTVPSSPPADASSEPPSEGSARPASGPPTDPSVWFVGCHIPGHLAKGMWIPIRWLDDIAS